MCVSFSILHYSCIFDIWDKIFDFDESEKSCMNSKISFFDSKNISLYQTNKCVHCYTVKEKFL